jgi:hypothetical protein
VSSESEYLAYATDIAHILCVLFALSARSAAQQMAASSTRGCILASVRPHASAVQLLSLMQLSRLLGKAAVLVPSAAAPASGLAAATADVRALARASRHLQRQRHAARQPICCRWHQHREALLCAVEPTVGRNRRPMMQRVAMVRSACCITTAQRAVQREVPTAPPQILSHRRMRTSFVASSSRLLRHRVLLMLPPLSIMRAVRQSVPLPSRELVCWQSAHPARYCSGSGMNLLLRRP